MAAKAEYSMADQVRLGPRHKVVFHIDASDY